MDLPKSHLRFPLFDSLRGFAAISILVVHVSLFTVFIDGPVYSYVGGFLAHLDIGVAFFFLLSAFLLYRPFVAARMENRNRPAFSGYARRRFLRIAPAYWAALTISAVVPGMVGAFGGNWWVYYGLLQNYPIFTPLGRCAVDPYRCAIPPAWSLAVEILFYAMLPLIVIGLAWLGRQRRTGSWLVPELGAIAILALVSLPIQGTVPSSDLQQVLFFSPIGRGLWFALGLGLASVSVWVQHRAVEPKLVGAIRRKPSVPILAGLALYLGLSFFVLTPSPSAAFPFGDIGIYLVQFVAFGLIALLVLLPATFGSDGSDRFRRFLRHPVPTWLGLVSYGVFLWQFPALILMLDLGAADWWPAMSFAVLLITTFALTVACAAVSYYALERPLMRWGRRTFSGSPSDPAPTEAVPDAAVLAGSPSTAVNRDAS